MKIISRVDNLTRHDLIYLFDKIKVGEQVEVKKDRTNHCIWVTYKNYKIGTLDNFDFNFWGLKNKCIAKINSISTKKNFPFENLDIEIQPTI